MSRQQRTLEYVHVFPSGLPRPPGCSNFAQIAALAGTSFSDMGLTAGTSYSYLSASNPAGNLRPAGGGSVSSTGWEEVDGPSAIAVNVWTHLALTYDGANLRLYVNGVQVASQVASGTLESNSNQMSFGGDAPHGEFFKGRIDEVRVYNRALSASEIQADMATPTGGGGDTSPPSAPTGLSAGAASASQINLSWSASTDNVGVTGYRVERCAGAGCSAFALVASVTGASFNDTGLAASTSYSYRVQASDAAGNLSGYSGVASATTQPVPDTTPPTAPAGLSASVGSASQIDLTWTASTDNVGVAGYQIDRCQGAGCTAFTQIATSSVAGFSDTGLAASTTYRYQVRATDAAGNVSANSSIVTATTQAVPDTTPPSVPAGLGATAASATQIDLSWAASSDNVGVTGYRVERCAGAGCGSFAQIATPTGTSYSDAGLTPATSYSYRVRAADAAGNLSAYSNVASAATQAGQLYYIVPDHLNTPRMIANQQGATVWKWEQQEPFGSTPPNDNPSGLGSFDFPLRFPGQYFDRETNLAYNYFRDYDPSQGRYVESDPIGLWGGFNTYAYASLSPIRQSDATGEVALAGAVIGGIIGGGFNLYQQLQGSGPINWAQFAIATGGGAISGASGAWVATITTSIWRNALANAVIGATTNFAQQSLSNLASCQTTPVYQGVGWNVAMGYAFGALGGGLGQIASNQVRAAGLAAAISGVGSPNLATNILAGGNAAATAVGNAISNYGNLISQPNNGYWY